MLLLLVALWAGLLITLMILRPAPSSFLFWALIGSAMAVGGVYMSLSRREGRDTEKEVTAWNRTVHELVDVHDFEDDGHLAEYFDDLERRTLIEELERMPAGSRSLRRAIESVSPELLRDDS